MKTTEYRYQDGSPVREGVCVRPLASRTVYSVTMDSMSEVPPAVVMAWLRQRWGVVSVDVVKTTVTCKGFTQ